MGGGNGQKAGGSATIQQFARHRIELTMYIDFAPLAPDQIYQQMIQTLIPRPIAWVLSGNADDSYNLAPFSYFNAVCSDPPLLMLSIGRKPDGSLKDTRVNIEQRRHFVIHIPHRQQAEVLTATAASLPAGESEVQREGLQTVAFADFQLPRLADCRVAYACECHEVREIGAARQALILGEVRALYVDDAVLVEDNKGRRKVAADKLDPLGRLGADEYLGGGEIIRLRRPA
jgi:flavin reductase (DIM6/NTAB) family NADH-FMN oxidoreductase RutF